jgi:hypothetical protein
MTSLLTSLAERSVRAPSPDAMTGRAREGDPAHDAPPGAIVPRRRSRYEPQGPEPELGEVDERVEATAGAPPTAAPPPRREAAADVRSAPARPIDAPHPASAEPPTHDPVELAPRPEPAATPPPAVRLAAPRAPSATPPVAGIADRTTMPLISRAGDAAARPEPITARRERIATGRAAPAPVASLEQQSADEIAPALPAPPSRAPTARIAAPPPPVALAKSTALRPGEIAPASRRDPPRDIARRSDLADSRPSADQPAAPSVQVSIGRVEVRAVFAPPPSPARRPALAPAMSLEDYLKQRENG